MHKLIFIILVLLSLQGPVVSQSAYRFTKYTQQDGLAASTLVGINKDSSGYLWLLSENGLTRFDGYTFKVFLHDINDSTSISSSDVKSMCIDNNRNNIFLTSESICKYNPVDGTFKDLLLNSNVDPIQSYWPGETGIWALTSRQLIYIDVQSQHSFHYLLPADFKTGFPLTSFHSGKNFFLISTHYILHFNTIEKKFKQVTIQYKDTLTNKLKSPPVTFFQINEKTTGVLFPEGLFEYNSEMNLFKQYANVTIPLTEIQKISGLAFVNKRFQIISFMYDKVLCIDVLSGKRIEINLNQTNHSQNHVRMFSAFSGKHGAALISTSNAGIFLVDPGKGSAIPIKGEDGTVEMNYPKNVEYLLKDDNILWFTSPGIGLIKGEEYKPAFFSFDPYVSNEGSHELLYQNVRTICETDDQNLFIGTLNGLFQFSLSFQEFKSVISPVDSKPILEKNAISKILKDDMGRIWICTWHRSGVLVLDYANKKMYTLIPDDDENNPEYHSIRSMLLDSRGFLWLGTDADLIYRLDTKKINLNNTHAVHFEKINRKNLKNRNLNFKITFAIYENKKGHILIGTQNGFYIYNAQTDTYKRFINNPGDKLSLQNDNIRCFFIDKKDRLWIGTNGGGLNYFNQETEEFKSYKTGSGLPDNAIYSIVEDNKGFLWLGTNKGLCKFDPETETSRNFSPEDGIQNYEFNTNAACLTKDEHIVFGGINGFTFFHPDSIPDMEVKFQVAITEVKIFDKEIPLLNNIIPLKYNQNYLTFQFAALNYFRNQENRYAYMLEGLDNDWVNCGNRRYTNYANLAPGSYTFRVKSANYAGVWNESAYSFKVIIASAWWNTWYFRTILVLIICGILYGIYWYRLRETAKFALIRNRIARDLHDEVGSNLSSISIFSEVAKEKMGVERDDVKPLLNKISSYTQSSMDAINDIVWVINSKNDRFENITIRMRTLAAEIIESLGCELHFHFDEKLNKIKMGMEQRKNLYLIYKEALNNIAKYADCKHLYIEITHASNSIHLKINDDGIGFNMEKVKKGNGMYNMLKRAESLGGTLHITSAEGSGTTILLKFQPW